MSGTVRLVNLYDPTGMNSHVFVCDDVLSSEEVLAHIRSEGFTGDVSVYDNMRHVTRIPVVVDRVDVVQRFTNELICSGETVRDAVASAVADRISLAGAHLEGADLSDLDLRGVNFCEADLCGADFSRADVTGVSFRGVDISGATFDRTIGFKMP